MGGIPGVHGVGSIRIIDLRIMPMGMVAHTTITVSIIGERGVGVIAKELGSGR